MFNQVTWDQRIHYTWLYVKASKILDGNVAYYCQSLPVLSVNNTALKMGQGVCLL